MGTRPIHIPMEPSSIQVIFFDAVGTLFDVKGSVGEVYLQYAAKYGVPDTPEMCQALNHGFRETMADMPPPLFSVSHPNKLKQCERLWWFDVVHAVFYRVGMFEGFDDFFEEVFQGFERPDHWELFPESIEVLTQLKQRGFELGIISNFDTRFFKLHRALGIDALVDSVTISSLAGSMKPAKEIFAFALNQHMVTPEEAIHVGDHPKEDFEGARDAGLHALLVDRSLSGPSQGSTISDLSPLLTYETLVA